MVKREHHDELISAPPIIARRSCTPLTSLHCDEVSNETASSTSLKEILVDIRLMKHSMLEMQDSIKQLFSKVEVLMGDQSSNTVGRSATPEVPSISDHAAHVKDATMSGGLDEGASLPGLPDSSAPAKRNRVECNLQVPYSHRSFKRTNIPSFPADSLIFLPFITALQFLQKAKSGKSVDIDEVNNSVKKFGADLMMKGDITTFEDFIVKAQKLVDVSIDQSTSLCNQIYLRDMDRPWLTIARLDVPSWRDQQTEIIALKKLPATALQEFHPLIDALLSTSGGTQWMGSTKLKATIVKLCAMPFQIMCEQEWNSYFQDAARLCNIQVTGRLDSIDNIRMSLPKEPFRLARFNEIYFYGGRHIVQHLVSTEPRQMRAEVNKEKLKGGASDKEIVAGKKRRLDI